MTILPPNGPDAQDAPAREEAAAVPGENFWVGPECLAYLDESIAGLDWEIRSQQRELAAARASQKRLRAFRKRFAAVLDGPDPLAEEEALRDEWRGLW